MKLRSVTSLFLAVAMPLLTPYGVHAQGRLGNREDERKPGNRPNVQRPNPGGQRNPITGSSVKNRPNPNNPNNPNRKPAPNNNNNNRPNPKGNNPNQRPNNPNPNPRPNPNPATKPAPAPGRVGVPAPMPKPNPNPGNPNAGKGNPNNPNNPNAGKNKGGNNPPKPRPNPPANANRNPNAPKPAPKKNNFVPGKVVYPSRVGVAQSKPKSVPNPNHPARRPNRARPQNLSQVISNSNVNSNNRVTNVTNVNRVTNNNTYVSNNWGNQWTNNRATIWNNNRVVNNRPVVVNANFQRSVNYAYRPASWGSRPWWSSSTYHSWHHGSWNYGWNRDWHHHHYNPYPVYGGYFPGYRPAPRPATVAAWGIAAWSLGSLAYDMGYNSYRNPYPAPPVQTKTTIINYTQPLSVVASKEQPEPEQEALSSEEKSSAAIARARDEFSNGDYLAAQKSTDEAIAYAPGDSALHEFRALCLFALGKYGEAAGVLNPVLASGPGWDWSTMSAFYPSSDTYAAQLRRLEAYVESHPDSADCHFLLGYHYMVAGFIDEAYNMFDRVVTLQPADTVSAQLRSLAESSAPEDAADTEDPESLTSTDAAPELEPGAVIEPIDPADLEGGWKAASPDGKAITLTLGADGNFTWNYEGAADAKVLAGEWSIDDDGRLVLAAADVQMVAEISLEDTTLRFVLAGSPVDDPGLSFQKL